MPDIPPGTHAFGPADGELRVNVFREGAAARMGHDLVFGVRNWSAKVTVDPSDLTRSSLEASAEVGSFSIVEARGGAKPLSRGDHADIRKNIEEKILDVGRFPTIEFRSTSVTMADETKATLTGELRIAGTSRPVDVALALANGRAKATLTVVQSQWGIKPFKALMGALKVRDAVDITLDVPVPT
ncbi:MAG: YceI family protein [Acidimicrobiia bacterium]